MRARGKKKRFRGGGGGREDSRGSVDCALSEGQ
jgi:hypothetical protein